MVSDTPQTKIDVMIGLTNDLLISLITTLWQENAVLDLVVGLFLTIYFTVATILKEYLM